MTAIVIGFRRVATPLLFAGLLVVSLGALAGCGDAEAQKPAPPAAKGAVPGGGDPKEYEAKMKEIQGGQQGAPMPK